MIERHIARKMAIALLASAFLLLAACSSEPTKESASGTHTISFRVDPDPPAGGKDNTIHVTVQDQSGKPVTDAQVHMTLTMPAKPEMKMPEMSNAADLKWTGSDYSAPIQISMAGGWNVVVEAKRGSEVLATHKTKIEAK